MGPKASDFRLTSVIDSVPFPNLYIIVDKIVYVARGDLSSTDRKVARNINNNNGLLRVNTFPNDDDQRAAARDVLERVFETGESTHAILLFDRERDARDRIGEMEWADTRILEVNLTGHLYRELRSFVQEVQYTGALPRIDGHAFLVFRRLIYEPETKEEKVNNKARKDAEKAQKALDRQEKNAAKAGAVSLEKRPR
ncbi:hypothetical protein F5X99DRAFT_432284 [Biscogniauxia marginata]|nr:hypothetical protein F5X99DRAFT_432284 [Biscogniauxia marginata]